MDIEILLALQNFRLATERVITPLLLGLSDFADLWILFLPPLVYWVFNKRGGLLLFVSCELSYFLMRISKLIVCGARPFMADPRIIPAFNATGWSFPSGHAVTAGVIYGGLAWLLRKRTPLFSVMCVILMLLTVFSRNYLGVHFMRDTIGGMTLGLIALWAVGESLIDSKHENKAMIFGIILCILSLLYVVNKSYPADSHVNPAREISTAFYAAGLVVGIILGRIVEKNFVKFQVTGINVNGLITALIGCGGFYVILFTNVIRDSLRLYLPEWPTRFAVGLFMALYVMLIWPFVISKVCNDR